MDRKKVIRNNVILIAIVGVMVFFVAFVNDAYHGTSNMYLTILFYLIGAIFWGVVNAFVHEIGHVVAGKKNGFIITAVTVWFFKWIRVGNKFRFYFTLIKEEAGFTESVPTNADNIEKRLKKMSFGGIVASGILMIASFIPLFFCGKMAYWLYSVMAVALPISGYYFFGNVIPFISNGVRNDGSIIDGINKDADDVKVIIALLKINAELYTGKTYSEIDEKLFFDLPQLPEDSPYFVGNLIARYNYYLDKEDYENAKKITERLIGLSEDMPKELEMLCKLNALYDACTFNYNDEKADDYMYEVENVLNADMSPTSFRIRLAYVLYVTKNKEIVNDFYKKCLKLCKKYYILGVSKFERKLVDRMKKDLPKEEIIEQ